MSDFIEIVLAFGFGLVGCIIAAGILNWFIPLN